MKKSEMKKSKRYFENWQKIKMIVADNFCNMDFFCVNLYNLHGEKSIQKIYECKNYDELNQLIFSVI